MNRKFLPTAKMDADFVAFIKSALKDGAKMSFTFNGGEWDILRVWKPRGQKELMCIRPARKVRRG